MPPRQRLASKKDAKRGALSQDDDAALEEVVRQKRPATAMPFIVVVVGLVLVVVLALWRRHHRGQRPYVQLPAAFKDATLQNVEKLYEAARSGQGAVNQTRQFGLGQDYLAGHRVAFLDPQQAHFQRLLPIVKLAAAQADKSSGWGFSSGSATLAHLKARVIELIEYEACAHDGKQSHALGWHDDGSSLMTVAVALSHPEEYEGGEFEVYKTENADFSGIIQLQKLQRGDALVWRGWERHRVRPVTRGTRRVLVVELWEQEQGMPDGRAGDTEQSFKLALRRAPSAAGLHAGLGALMARAEKYEEAEQHFSAALALAPLRADFHARLGQALFNQRRVGVALKHLAGLQSFQGMQIEGLNEEATEIQKRAEESLLKAVELDPNIGDAHRWLSILYGELGDVTRAERHKVRAQALGVMEDDR